MREIEDSAELMNHDVTAQRGTFVTFFAAPKKERKKGAFFYEVFFKLFYRTLKNRLKSAKFFPRLRKFLTGFLPYTSVNRRRRFTNYEVNNFIFNEPRINNSHHSDNKTTVSSRSNYFIENKYIHWAK